MNWQQEWGPQVPKLVEIEQATGVTPKALLEQPILHGIALEVSRAYDVLGSKRTSGLVPNPISLSEIRAYNDLYGAPTVPMDIFVALINTADIAYLGSINGHKSPSNR